MSAREKKRIRVALVQGNTLVRAGLRKLIESGPHFEVVAEAPNRFDVNQIVSNSRPDVIILDADTSSEVRLGLVPILSDGGRRRVLVLTEVDDPVIQRCAVRLGAKAVVSKKDGVEAFLEAIAQYGTPADVDIVGVTS